ncbi:DUF1670 domain-containing protein [Bacteroidota bacterium]
MINNIARDFNLTSIFIEAYVIQIIAYFTKHFQLELTVERWTKQAFDRGATLSQLDLTVLLSVNEYTAGKYVLEYQSLYGRRLPTRGNVQLIGGGQTHKNEIINQYLSGYLVPSICQRTNHSKDSVERYIRDFEAVRLLAPKFDDINTISLITRLSKSVVNQYIDLLPVDP